MSVLMILVLSFVGAAALWALVALIVWATSPKQSSLSSVWQVTWRTFVFLMVTLLSAWGLSVFFDWLAGLAT